MAIGIGRRELITALGGAAVWPLAARAQQRAGPRRLGVLMGYVENDPEGQSDAAAFVQGLGALNWKEGSNLRIDWRWGGSDPALFERYAAELIALAAPSRPNVYFAAEPARSPFHQPSAS